MAIHRWQVYYVRNCRHALPAPKNKFVVIACIDGGIPRGFFINSAVNTYIQARPYLFACEAHILVEEHPFLSHDSWVDCQNIFPFTVYELSDLRGTLSANAITSTRSAVEDCSVLKRRFKTIILAP